MVVFHTITDDAAINALSARLDRPDNSLSPLAANGLWGSAAPIVAALIGRSLGRPILYLTAHLEQADNARDDMETVLSCTSQDDHPAGPLAETIDLLPAWETLPGEGGGSSEIGAERARLCDALRRINDQMKTGGNLSNGAKGHDESAVARPGIIVAPIQAVIQPVPSPTSLDANSLTLSAGQQYEPEQIAAWLVERGFERLDQVEQPGDFALRGGILDIFASADKEPVRLDFFGDQIESIRRFDVGSQRSIGQVNSTRITCTPDPGAGRQEDSTAIFSYLPNNTLVVLHEPLEIAETAKAVLDRLGHPVGHQSFEEISKHLCDYRQLHLSRFPSAAASESHTVSLPCEALPAFDAKAVDAILQLIQLAHKQKVVVYCENRGELDRLNELIDQISETPETPNPAHLANGDAVGSSDNRSTKIETVLGMIHEGFQWRGGSKDRGDDVTSATQTATNPSSFGDEDGRDTSRFVVIPHHQLFCRHTPRRRLRKLPTGRPIESFLDLKEGDYVVHVNHGIARYVGMKTLRKGAGSQGEEFLTLRFADAAVLHVPVTQIDLVQKYVGARGLRPNLSKLGGSRWQTTKSKVEEAVTDLATDLLRVQAQRESHTGIAYPQDTHWQTEFESAFPYDETPDQTTSMRDIKADQMRDRPMDRLLCGDVGYGKTELAMRAAFKTVEFGKQVAVLVPTTVLADQHHRTFTERTADYPFIIECLSRFQSPRKQREIIGAAKKGHVDILIGTHRILSRDVAFADLGLVIVDEEQRFGVEHKERLKRLRSTVDVLTLTATPIPRTLHMAMVGLRDISSLATPPMDRRSIATDVCVWENETVREAIIRELNRDGQIFFVHNRVHSIQRIADRIASLVPDAKIAIGHGQMPQGELEKVMLRFVRHDDDILVCTTIIEAGLDIPNANTIFIDDADRFGLADLHQLRGRVGRYHHHAYCYLLLDPRRVLSPTAARRLKAIEQYSELGAGFHIAMRDLEIRGAGNILGAEQSGHIAVVGYELYCQLLEKCVRRMRGEPAKTRAATHLELNITAYIPKAYIASDRQRMECYRRFAACQSSEDVEQLTADLIDTYGAYPETVQTLLTLAEIRVLASRAGFQSIVKQEPDLIFKFDGEVKKIEPLFTHADGKASLPDGHTLHWRLPDASFHGQTLLVVLRNLFRPQAAPAI